MSYIRINLNDYIDINLDNVWEKINDDEFLEEAKNRDLDIKEDTLAGRSRRMMPQNNHEMMCEVLGLPSHISKELLLNHIKEML